MNFDPNSVELFNAAGWAALATVVVAILAYFTYRHQKRSDKNSLQLLQNEAVVKHIQELMIIFAEIRAISETEWSDGRTQELNQRAKALRKAITVIGSLHPDTGNRLHSWCSEKDQHGNSISSVVDYELGNIGAITGNKHTRYFKKKSRELRNIQDLFFAEFSA